MTPWLCVATLRCRGLASRALTRGMSRPRQECRSTTDQNDGRWAGANLRTDGIGLCQCTSFDSASGRALLGAASPARSCMGYAIVEHIRGVLQTFACLRSYFSLPALDSRIETLLVRPSGRFWPIVRTHARRLANSWAPSYAAFDKAVRLLVKSSPTSAATCWALPCIGVLSCCLLLSAWWRTGALRPIAIGRRASRADAKTISVWLIDRSAG